MNSLSKIKQKQKERERGFTIIELMVSLMVFSIVMTVSVGTLLVMINANAKAQAMSVATTNLSFALDSMTREIRSSHRYYCDTGVGDQLPVGTSDCEDGNYIVFTRDDNGIRASYRFNSDNKTIEYKRGGGSWETILAEDVDVESFQITVSGSERLLNGGNDEEQPMARILIKGKVSTGQESETSFSIQTSVVSRRLDLI